MRPMPTSISTNRPTIVFAAEPLNTASIAANKFTATLTVRSRANVANRLARNWPIGG